MSMELSMCLEASISVNSFRIRNRGFHKGSHEVALSCVTNTHTNTSQISGYLPMAFEHSNFDVNKCVHARCSSIHSNLKYNFKPGGS